MVIIAGWSGSILHDYHKCLHWEEGSGRICQAANPRFPCLCSQQFLLNKAPYKRWSSLGHCLACSPRAAEHLQGRSWVFSFWCYLLNFLAESQGILVSSYMSLNTAFYPLCFDSGHFKKSSMKWKIPNYFSLETPEFFILASTFLSAVCYSSKTLLKIFFL